MILEGRKLMVGEGLPAPKSNVDFLCNWNWMAKRSWGGVRAG